MKLRLLAAEKNKRIVTYQEFEDAKDKVMMGAERRSMVMTEDEKKLTAYHEGGHALVSFNMFLIMIQFIKLQLYQEEEHLEWL